MSRSKAAPRYRKDKQKKRRPRARVRIVPEDLEPFGVLYRCSCCGELLEAGQLEFELPDEL